MNEEIKKIFKEIPEFLSILGFQNAYLDSDKDEWIMEFIPSTSLTHSNGTIVQGGFVSGMVDACMAQIIMFKSEGKSLPLTLDIDVKFLQPCVPNSVVTAKSRIIRKGNSISFTTGELYQNDIMIATASASNKIINI